ncbi:MAG: saccharopine dehydrogenase NADP-binding domain-containing protein [Xanthomonadales bacterium]|nr:saccharopine dehydrogenase NADP-binding domain-containing protein [Xanthomonadales bacterium]
MTKRILIIGGYGNFGSVITSMLAQENKVQVIIAGRSLQKADQLASKLEATNKPETIALDININFSAVLAKINPDIVIHTSGPFQSQNYDLAMACVTQGCHYIDLADGRKFVAGITVLDKKAKQAGVLIISGASSVPCFTSALVDHSRSEFQTLEELDYGITTAQKNNPGLATTIAILSYVGKPFMTKIDGQMKSVFGWQNLHLHKYSELGRRFLGNCDVPDLTLFPKRYPELKTIRFYAGLELPFTHLTLWLLSWLVRIRLISKLEKVAGRLLKTSGVLDSLGTDTSGLHMKLSGKGTDGINKSIKFELIARSGDGQYIPCIPAIILAKKLINNE